MAFGAPKELVEGRAASEETFEVWRENWPAAELFLRLSTQWVFAGMGDRIGLNYQSVDFLLRMYPAKKKRQVFEDLQIMEIGALGAFKDARGK